MTYPYSNILDMTGIWCPNKADSRSKHNCGILIREPSSRLAEALGIMELRCDQCGQRYAATRGRKDEYAPALA